MSSLRCILPQRTTGRLSRGPISGQVNSRATCDACGNNSPISGHLSPQLPGLQPSAACSRGQTKRHRAATIRSAASPIPQFVHNSAQRTSILTHLPGSANPAHKNAQLCTMLKWPHWAKLLEQNTKALIIRYCETNPICASCPTRLHNSVSLAAIPRRRAPSPLPAPLTVGISTPPGVDGTDPSVPFPDTSRPTRSMLSI